MDILKRLKLKQQHFDGVASHLDLDYPEKIYGEAAIEITKLRTEVKERTDFEIALKDENERLRKEADLVVDELHQLRSLEDSYDSEEEVLSEIFLSLNNLCNANQAIDEARESE